MKEMGNYQVREIDILEAYIQVYEYTLNDTKAICMELLKELKKNSSLELGENDSQFVDQCLNGTFPDDLFEQPYILPWYLQLTWSLAYVIMIFVAITGNLIVIWIIVAHRRMRTVTNFFLLNLAVADFLLASGNAAFNFVFMLNSHWPFGATFCVISNFLANLTVSTSVFTILAVSLDRFVAVTRPLRLRMTKNVAMSVIFLVWTLSSAISVPSLMYATTITYRYSNKNQRTLCQVIWPDAENGVSYLDHVYNIMFLIVTYVVPMSCMAVTYTWVGCILWGSKAIGETTDLQNQVVKSKQRVVHLLIAVMLIFAICWLPYHIYFLYTYYNPEVLRTNYIQHLYLGIYWLAMSNSCYNPIVYYVMNARFRGYFQQVLCIRSFKQSSDVAVYGQAHRAYPLMARTSILNSNRTRSSRLSFPRRKAELHEKPKKEENNA